MNVKELYASVTAAIIRNLESGVASWTKPWKSVFTAASKASQAADYLRSFSEQLEEAA